MPVAVIDGLKVNYHMQGSGPHLLMLAPGGFNSTIESWTRGGVWKEMDSINTLSKSFAVIVYDRREAGVSGGRVEKLTWEVFARQGRAILDLEAAPWASQNATDPAFSTGCEARCGSLSRPLRAKP